MDPLFATLILILLALLGARVSFSSDEVPAGPRLLFRTGIHFLAIGFLVGPGGLELLTEDATRQLTPLLGLGLGWIGLHFGFQLDQASLSHFPRGFVWVTVVQAVVAFGAVIGIGLGLAFTFDQTGDGILFGILALAAVASVSAPAGVAMISANFRARGRIRELIFFAASIDGVIGLIALDLVYTAFHGTPVLPSAPDFAPWWFWALSSVALAVTCAVLFLWLSRYRMRREELVLFLLGLSALSSGAALQLQISPLLVGMLIGAVLTNTSRHHDRILRLMTRWEQPIYMILLLLAGASLNFPTWIVIPLAVGYAAVRAIGKVAGGATSVAVVSLPMDTPKRVGLGLIPQGGISLAMALSITLTLQSSGTIIWGFPLVDLLFGTIVLGVVVSDLAGPLLTHAVLSRAGELDGPEAVEGAAS